MERFFHSEKDFKCPHCGRHKRFKVFYGKNSLTWECKRCLKIVHIDYQITLTDEKRKELQEQQKRINEIERRQNELRKSRRKQQILFLKLKKEFGCSKRKMLKNNVI